jgi:hypothetical protein
MDNLTELMTPTTLATFAGAVLVTRLIVEHTKGFVDDATGRGLPTFLYAVLVAYTALYGASAILGTLGGGMWFAHIFNGFIVAIAAGVMEKRK